MIRLPRVPVVPGAAPRAGNNRDEFVLRSGERGCPAESLLYSKACCFIMKKRGEIYVNNISSSFRQGDDTVKLLTLYDKIFIATVLALGLLGFYFNFAFDTGMEQRYITIHVDNALVMEVSFNEITDQEIPVAFGPNHEYEAVVELKDGMVRMQPIDDELCPRGICSHTGWINRNYQVIVCVPNRIVVNFSDTSVEDVDAVTY